MRHILQYLTLLLLFSCGQQGRHTSVNQDTTSQPIDIIENIPTSTSKNIEAKLAVPDNIFLDTVKTFDSAKALRIEIVLPKSKDKQLQLADRLLESIITQEKNNFIKSVAKMLKDDSAMLLSATGSEFHVYPEEIYKDSMLLSYLFIIDIYHAGAPHSKTDYYSFNYDIKRQKQIKFSDYFSFKTQKDKDSLVHLINSIFNDEYVKAEKFYEFDFNLTKDTITFNFDDYEIASYAYGMQQAPMDKETLINHIKNLYK